MDNGYRMLQHTVRQVFGNLGAAARLTLLLALAPSIVAIVIMGPGTFTLIQTQGQNIDPTAIPDDLGAFFLGSILTVVVALITYCWAAVGWHRFILLEEGGAGVVPVWNGGRIMSYMGRAVVLVLVMIGIGILSSFILVPLVSMGVTVAFLAGTAWILGLTWVFTRLGLILPAAAVGTKMSLGESWTATKPVASDLLVPLIVIALAINVVTRLNFGIFGPSLIGSCISMAIYWIQMLLSLSLMTTIYGTQIEGRSLT